MTAQLAALPPDLAAELGRLRADLFLADLRQFPNLVPDQAVAEATVVSPGGTNREPGPARRRAESEPTLPPPSISNAASRRTSLPPHMREKASRSPR